MIPERRLLKRFPRLCHQAKKRPRLNIGGSSGGGNEPVPLFRIGIQKFDF